MLQIECTRLYLSTFRNLLERSERTFLRPGGHAKRPPSRALAATCKNLKPSNFKLAIDWRNFRKPLPEAILFIAPFTNVSDSAAIVTLHLYTFFIAPTSKINLRDQN